MIKALLLTPVALAAGLAACAPDRGTYPSLAPRPAEKRGFAEPEAPTPATVAADPALDAAIAAKRRALAAIVAGFDRDAVRVEAAIAKPGARTKGADAWLDAQTALASLDDWRSQASSLTSDVEGLASGRAATLAPPYPALETLRTAAAAEVTREAGRIRGFAAALPGT